MYLTLRKNSLAVVLVVFLSLSVSGCLPLIVGGVAAVGGYAVSRDTIQGESEVGFDALWEAAKKVVSYKGTILSESYELGEIKGVVNGAKTTVSVLQMTSSVLRLKVKARKFFFPSIVNAQDVFIKIMSEVDKGN